MKLLHKDETFKKHYIKGIRTSPNRCEIKLIDLLNEILPNTFQFQGYSKAVKINVPVLKLSKQIPDFVHNSKKLLIDLFSETWHLKIGGNGKTAKQVEAERMTHAKKYGFDTLVIWTTELEETPELVKKKILKWYNNRVDEAPVRTELMYRKGDLLTTIHV